MPHDPIKAELLDAILPHVAFDGWSPAAFEAAIADTDIARTAAQIACPRGAVDLAVAFHQRGDAQMVTALKEADLRDLRFRDKVAHAIRVRLAVIDDKEAVRRGATLFALPHMAPIGSKLVWGTADAIWTALGDTSVDANWYTKRLTLSGVYASVVLYWLGDDSLDTQASDAFIDRRIEDVMRFEKMKARVNDSAILKPLTGPIGRLMASIKAPNTARRDDLPGVWRNP